MNPTDEMRPKPSETFEVLETAGFAALAASAGQAINAAELLKRTHAFGSECGWPRDDQRMRALWEIIEQLDDTILPRLTETCRDAGVADLFDRARIWDRVPALSG